MNVRQIANNQIMIETQGEKRFYSYECFIALRDSSGNLYLGDSWDYSATTLKYLKEVFLLNMTKKEIQRNLDEGNLFHLCDYKRKGD